MLEKAWGQTTFMVANQYTDGKKNVPGYVFFSVRFFFVKIFEIHEIDVVDPQKWYHSIRLDESFQNLI